MWLKGKSALVTGGSRGIGRGIALKLAENGAARTCINYLSNESAANRTLSEIRQLGGDGFLCKADVTDPAQIQGMFEEVKQRFGTLDVMVSKIVRTVEEQIANDTENICQGRDPKQMRVIEIGCGAGRITRAFARVFGEVHGVDVSGEMVAQAKQALAGVPNAFVYQNNGMDLSVLPEGPYDFAFSTIVFQHIPSREVIYSYVREVHRMLRPGALFKFQVQGDATLQTTPDDTWLGVPFSDADAVEMAEKCGFEPRYRHGAGDQYFWLWFFKR